MRNKWEKGKKNGGDSEGKKAVRDREEEEEEQNKMISWRRKWTERFIASEIEKDIADNMARKEK